VATTAEMLARGVDCYERGAFQEAEQLFRQLLDAAPNDAEAHYRLGLNLKRQDRLTEAVASFQQAIQCRPDHAAAYGELGAIFQQSIQHGPAAVEGRHVAPSGARQPFPFRPDSAQVYNDLGVPLLDQGRLEEALAYFQQALRHDPNYPHAHNNIGAVLLAQGKPAEAVASFQKAVEFRPEDKELLCNLGMALFREGRLEEALARCGEALRIAPDLAEAHVNMGSAYHAQLKLEEALACFDRALLLKPALAQAHFSKALALLQMGDCERGWTEYEWRQACPFMPPPWHGPQPAWDGSALEGRTLLLRGEQGTGDVLQFIRFIPLVQQLGGNVIVEVDKPLMPLLRTCAGIDQVFARWEYLPPFDVHAFLLSLPRLLGTPRATLPDSVPYMAAEPTQAAYWRNELNALPRAFKVGICWQGNRTQTVDRQRSLPLGEFAPVAAVEGVHLVSLQKGYGTEQLKALGDRFPVTDLGSRLKTFMDTAALLMILDLVVTVDTACAHLAGALGVPVWIALPFNPDWRWLLGREDSPWYPTARLFRQTTPGAWSDVFRRIGEALRVRLAHS